MSERSTKDKAMAAYLKSIGDERTQCRCPMCHAIVGLNALPGHIRNHGPGRDYRREDNES